MTEQLPYPFEVDFLRRNKVFMLFCPPDRLDGEQRPVLEGRSMLYKLDESSYQICPYSDSREKSGKPINVESFKAFSRHHDAVRRLIHGIACYLSIRRSEAAISDLGHLYALAYIGYRAPSLYFCQKLFSDAVEIPAVCSVASRFFHGLINMLAEIAKEHNGTLAGVTMSAEQLYLYADKHGHLTGRKEVCPASKATIVKYLSLCLDSLAAPSRDDGPSALPFDVIGQMACMTMTLEFASFTYEMVRCWSWRKSLGTEPGMVRQRFATTHCLLAMKLTQFQRPFEHVFFRRAFSMMQALGSVDESVIKLIELARQGVEFASDDSFGWAMVHERLKEQMQNIFGDHAELLEQHVIGGSYLSSDLDVFFGSWPD